MYELDFLPVTIADGEGTTKSGDAICGRFRDDAGDLRVFVVDAGYQATGEMLVSHVRRYYNTDRVDLVISTHADADHLNGLSVVLDQLDVDELMIHRLRLHAGARAGSFSNIEAVDALLELARTKSITVSEPFTGQQRLDDHLLVLGPDLGFYRETLREHLDQVAGEAKSLSLSALRRRARNLLETALDAVPLVETLTDHGETDPRNEGSATRVSKLEPAETTQACRHRRHKTRRA